MIYRLKLIPGDFRGDESKLPIIKESSDFREIHKEMGDITPELYTMPMSERLAYLGPARHKPIYEVIVSGSNQSWITCYGKIENPKPPKHKNNS